MRLKGMSTDWALISDWPKVATRSRKTAMTVKVCSPTRSWRPIMGPGGSWLGEILGDEASLGSGSLVEIVEEAAFENEEVANLLEAFGDADEGDGFFLSIDDDAGGHVVGAGDLDDVGQMANGFHVVEGDLISLGARTGGSSGVVGIDDVGADALDLRRGRRFCR